MLLNYNFTLLQAIYFPSELSYIFPLPLSATELVNYY